MLRRRLRRWTRQQQHPHLRARSRIARRFLHGEGVEIGPMHVPLALPRGTRVRYLDRWSVDELRARHPDVGYDDWVDLDLFDDTQTLRTIEDESLDFVVANHVLEHLEDPLAGLANLLRVVKVGGYVFLALPDKRFTFDEPRSATPVEHLVRDHEEGPEVSRREHFEEWVQLVEKLPADQVSARIEELAADTAIIHYHVWAHDDLVDLFATLSRRFPYEVVAAEQHFAESVFVLRRLDGEIPLARQRAATALPAPP